MYVYQRRQQQEELDAKELAQAEAHRTELSLANAQHEVVRLQAEAVLQAYLKKEEEDRRRREEERKRREEEEGRRREEEEAHRRAEQERKEREERERKEQEERAKAEAQRQALHEKQKAEAEEKWRKEKEAEERRYQEEKAKADQEASKKQQEAAETAAAAATAAAAKVQPTAPTTTQISTGKVSPKIETIHQNYLAIHKKLKTFRKQFTENVKKDPNLKPHVGDMRRAMRTSVGQLTDDKVGNRKAVRLSGSDIDCSITDITYSTIGCELHYRRLCKSSLHLWYRSTTIFLPIYHSTTVVPRLFPRWFFTCSRSSAKPSSMLLSENVLSTPKLPSPSVR